MASSHFYQLYHDDCFQIFPTLPDRSVDVLVTDPPYGRTALPWDRPVDWKRFWPEAERVCKDNAVIVVFSAQPFTTDLINSRRSSFRYELIWHKTLAVGWLDSKRRPLRAHENILIFARHFHKSIYHPQKESGFPSYRRVTNRGLAPHYNRPKAAVSASPDGSRYPRSVLLFPNRNHPSLHPTQKPVALLEWLVRSYSNPGDVVLDPFMGVGTTGLACLNTGRRFIGIESDQGYYDIAATRLAQKSSTQKSTSPKS